jgi:hypothetical protein
MKSYLIIIAIILGQFIVSCDSELEIDPKQGQDYNDVVSTESGVTDILTGAYATLASGGMYGGSILISSDLIGQSADDATNLFWQGTFANYTDMFYKTLDANNISADQIWSSGYATINACNTVIENIAVVQDPEKQKRMIAEATFIKSLVYFDLVRLYALPYEAGQPNEQLGVVIRTKAVSDFSQNFAIERSTVKKVYDLIITGLNSAYLDLPANNGFYANKYAAKALLARVYLQQGNFAAARDAANEVITNSGRSLSASYDAAFNHDSNQNEDIFAIQITSQTGDNQLNEFYASQDNGGRGGDIFLTQQYLDKFDDSNDARRNFTYLSTTGDVLSSKYNNEFGNVVIIRLAEMHLIRAEANLEEGTSVGNTPLNDLNFLRKRANAFKFEAGEVSTALIRRERELELGMEGFAIHDIKRTQSALNADLDYNSNKLVFPIPLSEKDSNPKITQNPGY